MSFAISDRAGVPVLLLDETGPALSAPQDALDLIGATWGQTDIVAVPVSRLDPEFFTLSNGIAGEIMQKFVNYHVRLAVVGDVSPFTTASRAVHDLVYESNKGAHVWFVPSLASLDSRLTVSS